MLKKLGCIAFLLALSSTAVNADRGLYIGAGFGSSDINEPGELGDLCSEYGIDCGKSESDTQIKGILGYKFNDYFALEGTIFDAGSPALIAEGFVTAEAAFELRGISFSLLPQVPLGQSAYLFGRLGLAAADATLTVGVPSLNLVETDSSEAAAVVYGIGAGVKLGDSVSLRLEWERYNFDEALKIANIDVDAPELDVISGSIIFSFSP